MSQLLMEKTDLTNVPTPPVPDGYLLRTFQDGDEAGLGRIYEAAALGAADPESVRDRMMRHPCFRPDRIFVVEHNGQLAGTAAAWIETGDPGVGYLHMLGVLPEHRGKGLGALLAVETIHYTRNEGFSAQRLLTDDWREPAVKLYLDLGYYPLITDETHPERWQALAEKLNRHDAIARARRLVL